MEVRTLTVALLAVLVAGCGGARSTASSADDLLRWTSLSRGQLDELLARTRTPGTSQDDLLRSWRSRVVAGKGAYAAVPDEAKEVACGVATDALEAIVNPEERFDVVQSGLSAVATLNQTVASRELGRDLEGALRDLGSGQPSTLDWLVLKSATCAAVE